LPASCAAHHAAREVGIRLVVGCRLDLRDGMSLLAFSEDRAAYGRLTRLLTLGKRRAPKGECHLDYADVVAHGEVVAALAGIVWGWSNDPIADQRVREAGLDPTDRNLRLALDLAAQLVGFPRHLSQHVGGFVITRGPLSEMVPIENAAMEDRTVIEWDKDDLDQLGILKIDVLALGMLTCIPLIDAAGAKPIRCGLSVKMVFIRYLTFGSSGIE
jgi:DNA polymerase III alpha subunit